MVLLHSIITNRKTYVNTNDILIQITNSSMLSTLLNKVNKIKF